MRDLDTERHIAELAPVIRQSAEPLEPKRRLHVKLAETRQSPEGKLSFELGAKVGYWPCLKGPFVAIALGYRRLDIWYGEESYWVNGKPPENQ